LTVVIPAKNEEILLPRLLVSLRDQDYPLMPHTIILLADAGSTDKTVDIALGFSDILEIQVIEGGLPSIGRNLGARIAQSSYVLFIDADIELADRTLIRRAVECMNRKRLHCVTTDIVCREGVYRDRLLFTLNNIAQRLSRFHKPFATGMFMMVDKERFDEIGGFDEKALYAEDYQFTQKIARSRFRVVRGSVYSTNRRFQRMGRWNIVRSFLSTLIHHRNPEYFRNESHQAYWDPY
jgi:glycosyltransferase involved in cell wall biosynthesis